MTTSSETASPNEKAPFSILSMFKGIRFIGILVGWLIDEGLTGFGAFVIVLFAGVLYEAMGNHDSIRLFPKTTLWYVVMLTYGDACTVAGGFFTGCIAKSHRVKNGMALWVFEYGIHCYDWFRPSELSIWFESLENITSFASACFGAWIAKLVFAPGK